MVFSLFFTSSDTGNSLYTVKLVIFERLNLQKHMLAKHFEEIFTKMEAKSKFSFIFVRITIRIINYGGCARH